MRIEANIAFRPAEKEDLLRDQKTLRYGQPYLVMGQDGATLSGFHIIDDTTDAFELSAWFKSGRVFVPESCLDQPIVIKKRND